MPMRPLLLLAWTVSVAGGVAPARGEGRSWSSRVWQTSDGLPDKTIAGVGQAADGFLWVATAHHLTRFDGVRFEPFALDDIVPGIREGLRTAIQSRDGGLWVAMNRGPVVRLGAGPARVYSEGVPAERADELFEDHEGALWIGYYEGTLCRLKNGVLTRWSPGAGVPSVAEDGQGQLWVAQGGKLGVWRDGRIDRPQRTASFTRIASARNGGVWVGADDRLSHIDAAGRTQNIGALPSEHHQARITVLLESRDGSLWIGTRHNGLLRHGPSGFESVPTSDPLIRTLIEDREGNIWVGTGGGGLNRVQPRAVEIEGADTGVSSRLVQSIAEDPSGDLWGATQSGLVVRRTGDEWRTVALGSDRAGSATSVAADGRGNVWIGTRDSRLHRLQKGHVTTFSVRQGLEAHTICTMLVSRAGDLWIAGEGPPSVQRVREGKFERFALPDEARSVHVLAEDARGEIWAAAQSRVLMRARNDRFEEEPAAAALPQRIRCLHGASDGSLWIGYDDGGGLARLKDGRLDRIGRDQGLTAFTIWNVLEDPRGWMWLGTDQGVFQLRRRELDAVIDGRAPRLPSVRLGAEEAPFTLPANACGRTAAILTRSGLVWMPMGTALAVVHPDRLVEDPHAPPVLLTRVAVDGVAKALYGGWPLPPGGGAAVVDLRHSESLRLGPGDRRIEIDFSAPTFRAPEAVRFRFRLDGLDDAWTEAGAPRTAAYGHLAAGRYRFRVTACNAFGVCNETGAALTLVIAPQVWQTWWFRLVALTLFTFAVVLVVRAASFRRLRSDLRALEWRERLHKERARIARDIHDEIGNRLTTITLLSGLAQRDLADAARAGEHVRQISTTARQVTDSLDEIVWAVNPGNDLVPQVVDYVGQFAVEFARPAGLRIRVDLPERPPAWTVSAEVRHNLFLVVKEALNNIVRHAGATEVALGVTAASSHLGVTIVDDGRGFEPATSLGGNGLANMRQRMEEVGGEMRVERALPRGTRVELRVPLSPSPRGRASGDA